MFIFLEIHPPTYQLSVFDFALRGMHTAKLLDAKEKHCSGTTEWLS